MYPETKYARLDGDGIAYQALGKGPPDLVLAPGSFRHLDIAWEDPGIAPFCRTLASSCRLIMFDRRGTGISDPLPPHPLPPWESYAEELAAVLDELGLAAQGGRAKVEHVSQFGRRHRCAMRFPEASTAGVGTVNLCS